MNVSPPGKEAIWKACKRSLADGVRSRRVEIYWIRAEGRKRSLCSGKKAQTGSHPLWGPSSPPSFKKGPSSFSLFPGFRGLGRVRGRVLLTLC